MRGLLAAACLAAAGSLLSAALLPGAARAAAPQDSLTVTFTMGNQTCVQVPAGGTNTLWIQVATPLATSTVVPQNIQLTATPVKDP